MSLLLDALKKAAEEKNKSADASQNSADVMTTTDKISDSDSMELELNSSVISEIDDSTERLTHRKKQTSEDFPVVDQVRVLNSTSKPAAVEKHKPAKVNSVADIDENTSPIDLTSLDIEETSIEPVAAVEMAKNIEQKPVNNATQTNLENKPSNSKKAHYNSSKKSNIEKEKILSELIKNSNQQNEKERFMRNISIAILIVLIVVGSGLYFFLEIKTTDQGIYLPQDTVFHPSQASHIENPETVDTNLNKFAPTTSTSKNKQSVDSSTIAEPEPKPKQYKTHISSNYTKPPEPVKFVKKIKADPVHKLLMQAYNAFYNQEYKQSQSLYKRILSQEKNNRDALLGLAAIAIKQNRFEYARQKYRYLLKLNPKDSLATAGLSSIENQMNLQLSESRLKFMIKNKPDSAHLYFALGSLYARQQKWPEAQSAYFSAWSASSNNADYAFNLAVSLDHLDKKKQALQYYQHCLKLKQSSHANFSATSVEERISTLLKSIK